MSDRSGLARSGRPAHQRTSATGGERVVALDGVRAYALLLIMGFHFGVKGLSGGFIGVDIFYVLSGFLITGLLLGEWARSARIKLGAFWLRRARRLLPALCVVLVVVTLVIRFTYPAGLYPNLRMADLSALFYFSNWWQIAVSSNYFVATGAVSPLTHTWSLAVEEQFYLVWPLVVLAVLHLAKRFTRTKSGTESSGTESESESSQVARRITDRGVEILLGISVIGVVASATEMAWLYHPRANITRLYFGTDTHAQSILVGSVLACTLTLVQRHRGNVGMAPVATSRRLRVALTVIGLTGLAGTLALSANMSGTSAFAYQGGFLLSALSAAALITGAVCVARGPIARVLSVRPMVWVGTVSYGAYLWHFPVAIELDSARTGLGGEDLLAVRVLATFTVAAASYYLIERPVMEGVFWRSLKAAFPAVAAMAVTVVVVIAATVVPAVAAARVVRNPGHTLPAALHARLDSAGAFSGDPVRFLLLGDSMAITMSVGLATDSVPAYGVQVIDAGVFGCDYDSAPAISQGQVVIPYTTCLQWRTLYTADIARYHPDVVGLLTGVWSLTDREADGQTTHVGEPGWDAHLVAEYADVVHTLAAQKVKVVLFTLPYIDPPQEAPDGAPYPEDQPSRVVAFNRDLARVAVIDHGEVTVINLNADLSPHGRFQTAIDGVTVRWPDGIHVTPAGGQWLQPRILPTVALLGLEARSGVTG